MTKAEIRELRIIMCGGRCEYPGCTHYEGERLKDGTIIRLQMHHALLENSKRNLSKYPLLTNSLINQRMVDFFCHELHRNFWNISDHHADFIEKYLRDLKEAK